MCNTSANECMHCILKWLSTIFLVDPYNQLVTPFCKWTLVIDHPSYLWAKRQMDGRRWRWWGALAMVSRAGRAFPTIHTHLPSSWLNPRYNNLRHTHRSYDRSLLQFHLNWRNTFCTNLSTILILCISIHHSIAMNLTQFAIDPVALLPSTKEPHHQGGNFCPWWQEEQMLRHSSSLHTDCLVIHLILNCLTEDHLASTTWMPGSSLPLLSISNTRDCITPGLKGQEEELGTSSSSLSRSAERDIARPQPTS